MADPPQQSQMPKDLVFAGMMEELGIGRKDTLPLADSGQRTIARNPAAPVPEQQPRVPSDSRLEGWITFGDNVNDVTEAEKSLDTLGDGQLYRMSKSQPQDTFTKEPQGAFTHRDGRGIGLRGARGGGHFGSTRGGRRNSFSDHTPAQFGTARDTNDDYPHSSSPAQRGRGGRGRGRFNQDARNQTHEHTPSPAYGSTPSTAHQIDNRPVSPSPAQRGRGGRGRGRGRGISQDAKDRIGRAFTTLRNAPAPHRARGAGDTFPTRGRPDPVPQPWRPPPNPAVASRYNCLATPEEFFAQKKFATPQRAVKCQAEETPNQLVPLEEQVLQSPSAPEISNGWDPAKAPPSNNPVASASTSATVEAPVSSGSVLSVPTPATFHAPPGGSIAPAITSVEAVPSRDAMGNGTFHRLDTSSGSARTRAPSGLSMSIWATRSASSSITRPRGSTILGDVGMSSTISNDTRAAALQLTPTIVPSLATEALQRVIIKEFNDGVVRISNNADLRQPRLGKIRLVTIGDTVYLDLELLVDGDLILSEPLHEEDVFIEGADHSLTFQVDPQGPKSAVWTIHFPLPYYGAQIVLALSGRCRPWPRSVAQLVDISEDQHVAVGTGELVEHETLTPELQELADIWADDDKVVDDLTNDKNIPEILRRLNEYYNGSFLDLMNIAGSSPSKGCSSDMLAACHDPIFVWFSQSPDFTSLRLRREAVDMAIQTVGHKVLELAFARRDAQHNDPLYGVLKSEFSRGRQGSISHEPTPSYDLTDGDNTANPKRMGLSASRWATDEGKSLPSTSSNIAAGSCTPSSQARLNGLATQPTKSIVAPQFVTRPQVTTGEAATHPVLQPQIVYVRDDTGEIVAVEGWVASQQPDPSVNGTAPRRQENIPVPPLSTLQTQASVSNGSSPFPSQPASSSLPVASPSKPVSRTPGQARARDQIDSSVLTSESRVALSPIRGRENANFRAQGTPSYRH